METYITKRPQKHIYPVEKIIDLRNTAIQYIKSIFLPDEGILKMILIGSSVKLTFGTYEPPGFRGSLYSDFDVIVFVSDNYIIPNWLQREPDGKPFSIDSLNLAYRQVACIEETYDIEVFFLRVSSLRDTNIQCMGEAAGIPMTSDSVNPYIVVYEQKNT
jgi:hypothetical protein